jgi:CubicO group peptidase (beta-lactamase class C family)
MGRHACTAVVGLLLVATAACAGPPDQASGPTTDADRVCDKDGCVSVSQLAQSIDDILRNKVVGYVTLVGQDVHVRAFGQARAAADPPALAMGATISVNTASVGKMFTTVAVLQTLARHHLSIDSRIAPYLPADWTQGPGIDTVTFRELLTHRAGFRYDSGTVFTDDQAAREQIRIGITPADKTAADYNNLNFIIFRDLVPILDGVADPGPRQRTYAADAYFIDYLQRHVFGPVGVTDARCAEVTDAALFYPPPKDNAGVRGQQLPVGPSACAAGGWFISPASMMRVLKGLLDTNALLTTEQKQLMNDGCLGWDCSVASQLGFRAKEGDFGDPPTVMMISFAVVKGSIPLVMVTNSGPGRDLQSVLMTAMANATVR